MKLDATAASLETRSEPARKTASACTDNPILRVSRRHHGNLRSSVITQGLVNGDHYNALAEVTDTFRALLGKRVRVTRGSGEGEMNPGQLWEHVSSGCVDHGLRIASKYAPEETDKALRRIAVVEQSHTAYAFA